MKSSSFDMVVAMDLNAGIGKAGGLPWHLPADLKHFKEITLTTNSSVKKNAVIMGRKTWESLPEKFKPLPGRINAVITRNPDFNLPDGVLKGNSLDDILIKLSAMSNQVETIFVIGGAQIFQEALKHAGCRKIYVTKILKTFDCDTFFPPLNPSWKAISQSPSLQDHSLEYSFLEYVKALSS